MMPFDGGVDSVANGTLLLSGLAALLYRGARHYASPLRRMIVKTLAVALLAVLAFIEGGPLLLVAALVLSAAGDAFLAREGETAFLAGLASFLAAHLAYLALFLQAGGGFEILQVQPWRLVLPVVVLGGAALLLARLMPAVPGRLRVPVTAYVVAILAMMMASSTVANPIVMAGAALFVTSDAILAVETFLLAQASRHRLWTSPALWVLYYLSQAIITLAFLL